MLGKSSYSDIWWNTKEEITSKPVLKSVCVGGIHMHTHTHLPHISWPEYFCSPQSEALTASVYQAHSHTQRSMKGFQLSILTTWLHTNIQIYSCTKSLASENPSEENLTCCKGEFRWSIPICEDINCVQHVQLKR